ncbi:fungal pheromone mating factor STE2 GPCR-domain-containing protein [Lipomyces japonicus]|uniref:fungal pheromone mating factor STE2 GPCR-domain-containing protein n=1 Tax=Lipomyces japonicus TaxID=56871 RepID=UPI0034CE6FA4
MDTNIFLTHPQSYDPTSFTPLTQPLSVVLSDGSRYNISATDVDQWLRTTATGCVLMGVQIGSCIMVALVLALLTKPSKRRTPVFMFNQACLFVLTLQAGMWINYALGPFVTFGAMFSNYYDQVPFQAYVRSSVTTVLNLVVIAGIELSLVFQVRIVFDTHRRLQRNVTVLCAALALTVMVFWTVTIVQHVKYTMGSLDYPQTTWVATTAKVLYAVSISTFSGIFCFKLWLAIRQRRAIGLREFGPLQVIFIMATQTMVVPTLLTIIQMAANIGVPFSSLTTLFVVLSLPLSALWASATNDLIASARRSQNGSTINNSNNSNSNTVSTTAGSTLTFPGSYMFKNSGSVTHSSASALDLEKQDSLEHDWKSPITVTRTIVAE